MIRSKHALAMAALLLVASTAAAVETTYTFTSVTKIEWTYTSEILLTGVLANDTVPSTATIPSPNQLCTGHMDTLLKNPGGYILKITTNYDQFPNGPISFTTRRCSLEVVP